MFQTQKDVIEFMHAAAQAVPDEPGIPDLNTRLLRVTLIAQELRELCHAFAVRVIMDSALPEDAIDAVDQPSMTPSLKDAWDASLDLQYVVEGTSVSIGLDNQPGWDDLQTSNMSKFIDGHRAPNGKFIKGPSYRPVNLQPLIDEQLARARARKQQTTLFEARS